MKPIFLSLAAVCLVTFLPSSPTFGETVVLTNGNKIDGTVIMGAV